jgi:GT2 family glycosyltransferase
MYDNVTLVLTSCNRLDLLQRTISSMPKNELNSIPKKILIDDSSDVDCFEKLKHEVEYGYLKDWTLILNYEKLGQPASIDRAYQEVNTDYVFHCEDDWNFSGDDFIQKCLNILDKYDNVLQVTFRKDSPHPVCDEIYEAGSDFEFEVLIPGYNGWPGFTYNPNIFRFSAYQKIGPIGNRSEKDIGLIYKDMELFTVALKDRYVNHIGHSRHVFDIINNV